MLLYSFTSENALKSKFSSMLFKGKDQYSIVSQTFFSFNVITFSKICGLTRLWDATEGHRTELLGSYIGFNRGFRISAWFRYDLCKGKKEDVDNYWQLEISSTNIFHDALRLFSNRSQMTSKYGEKKKVSHKAKPSVSMMFLPRCSGKGRGITLNS